MRLRRVFPLAALAVLLLVGRASAQAVPLVIDGETTIVVKALPFKVRAAAGADLYIWNHASTVTSVEDGDTLTVTAAPKGEVTVKVQTVTIDWASKKVIKAQGKITFSVGAAPVPPVPPEPPTPPEPTPPGPTPDPAPIPLAGFRCLIVFESAEASKLPAGQHSIIYGKAVRDALNAACTDDPQTGTKKAYWILDKDADVSALSKHWQDAMKRPRKSVPWLILSNGKAGFEGPLPSTTDEMLALIKKYSSPAAKKGGR